MYRVSVEKRSFWKQRASGPDYKIPGRLSRSKPRLYRNFWAGIPEHDGHSRV